MFFFWCVCRVVRLLLFSLAQLGGAFHVFFLFVLFCVCFFLAFCIFGCFFLFGFFICSAFFSCVFVLFLF